MNIITDAMGAQITAAITADSIGFGNIAQKYDLVADRSYSKEAGLDLGAKPAPVI